MTYSRPYLLCTAAALFGAIASPGEAAARIRQFDVPAQGARSGIPLFAHQAGIQIMVSADVAEGLSVNRVQGAMEVTTALGILLSGTDLTPVTVGNAVVLRRQKAPAVVASRPAGLVQVAQTGTAPLAQQQGGAIPPQNNPTDATAVPGGAEDYSNDIVVQGFRSSLARALDEKRRSNGVVDVIKAEDIADFPDNNLAESIQRVPGVSIARDAGEGRQITVRGLGPQFTRVRVNGVEGQSTAGGTDSSGGNNRNRAFDFNVFASELFNSIAVRKTASAETEEGSLGATVDLTTARPFDYKKFTFVASAQGGFNDLSRKVDPKLSAVLSDTFADGTLGALVSASYTKRRIFEEGHGSGGWLDGTNVGGYSAASPFAAANAISTYSPRFPRYGRLTHDQERLGITGTLQWKPSDATLLSADVLYSKFSATRTENWLENLSFARPLSQGGRPEAVALNGEINGKGDMVYGVFNDVDIQSETRRDELSTKYTQYTLTGEQTFSDRLKLTALIGYSRSFFDNPVQTTVIINRENTDGYSYDYRPDRNLPLINYGFDVNDPASFGFGIPRSEIRLRPNSVENTILTTQANLAYTLNDGLTLKVGGNVKRYRFNSDALARVNEGVVPQLPAGTTLASLTTLLTGFGRNLGDPAGNVSSWITPDIDAFAKLFDIYNNSGQFALSGASNANARGNIRSVRETDTAGYAQIDFKADVGIPVRGDIGVRYVHTRQTSQGYQLVAGAAQQIAVTRSYDDWLPALNLTAEVTPDVLLRLGAAKVMTRPNLGSITPGGSLSTVGVFSVNSGNPQLEPIRANTVDLSAEWYFAPRAFLGIGLFYKDIKSFIQTARITQPFSASGLPASLLDGLGVSANDQFTFSQPVNTPGGPLKGLEINYQQPFSFLPGALANFGTLLNYTFVDSKIRYFSAQAGSGFVEADLTGLSKNAFNATLYYEDKAFSARVSAAYRDNYLTAVPSGTSFNNADGVRSTLTFDTSISYSFNTHFKITLEGLNLTDQFNQQFTDTNRDSILVNTHTGRQFYLGARYAF